MKRANRVSRGRNSGVRTRGGAHAVADARGGDGESSRVSASAAGPRRGTPRPSLLEPFFSVMIEDLPQGSGLERPLHPKKRRFLPSASSVSDVNLSTSESLEMDDAGPSSPYIDVVFGGSGTSTPRTAGSGPSTPRATKPRVTKRCMPFGVVPEVFSLKSSMVVPVVESPADPAYVDSETSSPALYVECYGSGTFTPRTARSGPSTPRVTRPSVTKRCMRPLQDHKTMEYLFYGSEEENVEDDEDNDTVPMLIPRTVRLFLEDERDEEGTAPADLNFAWPPPSPTSGSVAPASIWLLLDQSAVPSPDPVEQSAVSSPASVEQSAVLSPDPLESAVPSPDSVEQSACIQAASHIDKFEFQWRAFTQPQIKPELRRETFSNINCGATTPYATSYDAFIAIWDRQIMKHIVVETNLYAQQLVEIMIQSNTLSPTSRITKWLDTTVDELYVFFAILIATGIVVKTRLDEYWNSTRDIFVTPEFTTAMRYDRFLLLNRCIHFQNNETCNPASLTRAQAKLFKVQPLLDHLNHKFSHLYNMDQNVALDESLTMWKGWLDINQFIKNKAAAVGIKTYEVCESKTGYLWRFEVHAGHEEASNAQASPVSGLIPAIVLRLLNGLEHRGHTIWMDNYYNSPALARELKCRGFDCVGTLRTNRQFVPTELMNISKGNMAIGQVYGCTSGDVDLIVWRDKSCVALISTYHGLATVKCGDTLKPTVIHDYNICMGGVDRKDQMLAMFPIERKRGSIWYKKLFKRLLNASVLNAYILYKSEHSSNHRSFRKTLVTELLSRHSSQTRPLPIITNKLHNKSVNDTQGFEHYPLQYVVTERTNTGHRHRRNCTECGKRITTYCNGCNKPLCAFTCFGPYHTKLFKDTSQ